MKGKQKRFQFQPSGNARQRRHWYRHEHRDYMEAGAIGCPRCGLVPWQKGQRHKCED